MRLRAPQLALTIVWVALVALLHAEQPFALAGVQLHFAVPHALLALVLLPALVWYRAGSLRALALSMIVLALAQPTWSRPTERTATLFVVDVSDSVDDAALARAARFLERTHEGKLVTFAAEPRLVPTRAIARHTNGSSSQIEAALAFAAAAIPADARGRVVLFSDGRETAGSLLRAADALAARGISLWCAPHASVVPEVGIAALAAPNDLQAGSAFALRARIASSQPSRVELRLSRDGAPNAPDAMRTVELAAGETELSFQTRVRHAGEVQYRLELHPLGADRYRENNVSELPVRVAGPARVLYVEGEPAQSEPFADLLRAAGFEVDVRGPSRLDDLADFAFVVLSDLPADRLPRDLDAYVRDGGGLLIAGGERAFGPGGYRGDAIERLLPVALEGAEQRSQPSLALVLAIDKSGSMAGDKLERAKEAALATVALLPADAYLGVIGFDVEATRVARLARATSTEQLARAVGALGAGGGTALFPALDAAYADLAGVRARVKHVVALTDGQTQEEALAEIVRAMQADGITLSTIGLGEDVQRGLLTEIAKLAGGRAYFTRDPSQVPRLFVEETERLAQSLTVERSVRARQAVHASFLRGIALDRAPPLRGYVSTRARGGPAQVVLESDGGEPLLARMRVGAGWSLALTTDVKPRWSAAWFAWPQQAQLFAQLVREHMRTPAEEALAIETHAIDDQVEAAVDVLDARGRFVNGLTGAVSSSRGGAAPGDQPLQPCAPGRYCARLPAASLGPYTLTATLRDPSQPDQPPRHGRASFSRAFGSEYAPPFTPAMDMLEAAARRTGGGLVHDPKQLAAPGDRLIRSAHPLWPGLLWCALGAFLIEVTARRLPGRLSARRRGT